MGWVENAYQERRRDSATSTQSASESRFVSQEQRKWDELVRGLENDVKQFKRLGGIAEFERKPGLQCWVSNRKSGIAVVLAADLDAHAIRYSYEPENDKTAVPEGGVLSVRTAGNAVNLYSADQRLSSEEARRLVLEPLLFPRAPLEGLEPTGT